MKKTASEVAPITKAPAADPVVRLSGRLTGRVPAGLRRWLAIAFGLVYLQQAGRAIGWLFGLRTEAELTLDAAAIRVRSRTTVLGARTREADEVYPLTAIRRIGIERAAGGAFAWAGGGAFVAAVALAAVLGFRGKVGFGGSLLLAAIGFVALGLALDIGAYALAQRLASSARARLEIELADGRRLTVSGADRGPATAFLEAVSQRLAPPART
ncbi:MAG TPA: hypothetical protein VGQ83_09495 [Polyangia bacterium]|jgi:hypothetical protein